MEAIWNLEEKWKISNRGAIALLVICTCSLVIGTCIIAALRRNVRRRTEPRVDDSTDIDCLEPRAELGPVKEVLTSSVRWSQKEKLSPLLVSGDLQTEADFGWQNRGSASPVWKRPILMGEKCELPKFSGLILYDQRGHATSSSR
ncbi:hypothetical protein KY290_032183 [Solanum tuberosum]|uniref:Transmembrane protein n=1 Tax=Solanum tuberosum TaxID=4113 RepID=A0ABQ7UBE9_SOLTU|nr:hypothetical protein KY290_032183 [Solanum tuberosum]